MQILPITDVTPATISQLAERRLRESPYFFLKSLTCHFEQGTLTLRGRVPHSQLKRFAESIVYRVDGVQNVVNQVEVYDPMRVSFSGQAVRSAG